MTLQTSGPISFTDITNEFGSAPVKAISNYYGLDAGIPDSGPIKFSDLYGKIINARRTIGATRNFNARSDFTNSSIVGGYKTATTVFNNNQAVKYYLISTGIVDSANTSTTSFDSGNFPTGSSLYLTNNSYIVGAGGQGGNNDTSGSAGGPALTVRLTTYITNNGTIAGGGGGGAGGNSTSDTRCQQVGCCDQICYTANATGGGGGGGAGSAVGGGGSGGNSGQSGTFFTGGDPGSGYQSDSGNASTTSGSGAAGGSLGSAGDGAGGGNGGAAGNYIVNGSLATWLTTGIRLGGAA